MPSAKGQLCKYKKKRTGANLRNFWKQRKKQMQCTAVMENVR